MIVYVYGIEGIKVVFRVGVDLIEYGFFLDKDMVKFFKK